MPVTIVVGAGWGDEGKGKIVDVVAQRTDAVVRFLGGNNAGHTIQNEYGEFTLHLVPAGIFNPDAVSIIERGVVIHVPSLLEEMKILSEKGISLANLYISPFAHMVMPWHIAEDKAREDSKKNRGIRIGTTQRGIGPCYQDKAGRWQAFQMRDLQEVYFLEKLKSVYDAKSRELKARYGKNLLPGFDKIREEFINARKKILDHIVDTRRKIKDLVSKKKHILLEGAQGTLLDVDYGTYPYVTSSSTTSMAACNIAGVSPRDARIIGVSKAYLTRVGEGPFPTEMVNREQDNLRELGREYGATTGRPRRCGWLDIPLLRYAADVNYFTEIVITKLDVLGQIDLVRMCIEYEGVGCDIGDEDFLKLSWQNPVYEEFRGWGNLSGCHFRSDLPEEACRYLNRVERLVQLPASLISTGGKRKEIISL